ncbi:hypothetical protein K443DRAFT_349195 [Laccaria amethystina LaAM-08-1]|uniref:Uncharacterized protein n=1 Tax=Laccaria amethystina LaAM-08-1 TaxID=1095629 RepID=A0A0C9WSQ8_9AGAR|nr:hypothetical protein K443DRAFT_349195 [Laccaria amethystina LaAM-08-1]
MRNVLFSASLTCFMCNVHTILRLGSYTEMNYVRHHHHFSRVIYFFSGPLYIPSRKIYAPEYPCSGDDKKSYGYFRAWSVSKKQTIGRIVGCSRIFWLFLIVDDFIRSRNW